MQLPVSCTGWSRKAFFLLVSRHSSRTAPWIKQAHSQRAGIVQLLYSSVSLSKTPCSSKPFDNESLTVLCTGILVGIFLVLCLIGIGFFNYDGTMPVVSTNSRAISAACHVLEEDERYGYLLPVKWGVVQRQNGVGRCAMSTAYDIKMPNSALLYS
jgi:hypothetical protein